MGGKIGPVFHLISGGKGPRNFTDGAPWGAGADGVGLPPAAPSRSRNGASMDAKTLRTAAAVLVVLGLLAAAAPVAAAPEGGQAEAGIGPALVHHLTVWLAGLWPGAASAPPDLPTGLAEPLGPVADPDDEPAAGTQDGPTSTSGSDPTADPELGPRADPNG